MPFREAGDEAKRMKVFMGSLSDDAAKVGDHASLDRVAFADSDDGNADELVRHSTCGEDRAKFRGLGLRLREVGEGKEFVSHVSGSDGWEGEAQRDRREPMTRRGR